LGGFLKYFWLKIYFLFLKIFLTLK
jgi:hypothetical protein